MITKGIGSGLRMMTKGLGTIHVIIMFLRGLFRMALELEASFADGRLSPAVQQEVRLELSATAGQGLRMRSMFTEK